MTNSVGAISIFCLSERKVYFYIKMPYSKNNTGILLGFIRLAKEYKILDYNQTTIEEKYTCNFHKISGIF